MREAGEPFSWTDDGTPLELVTSYWTGQTGYWIARDPTGQHYQQDRYWGSDYPTPERWEAIER